MASEPPTTPGQPAENAAAAEAKPPQGPADTHKASAAKPAQPRAGSGRAAAVGKLLFNLVLLGGLGVIGYVVYEQDKAIGVLFEQQNSVTSDRNEALARLGQQQQTIEQLQGQLASQQQSLAMLQQSGEAILNTEQAQDERLDNLQKELVTTRLGIGSRYSAASQEWLLAEAASLLRLAQQHLVVARDVRTAQALYIAADDILKKISDPAIFSIREILAGELAAIRAVPEVDTAAIYLQLGAVSDQVKRLQVSNDLQRRIENGERVTLGDTATASEGLWSRFRNSIKNSLDNYLVVRRRDAPLQAMMTPGQEVAIMQGIGLDIEQARTALLKGQQEIYSNSLARARDTIASYLGGDTAVKNSVLDALDGLRDRRIVSDPPLLNRARIALEDLLATRDDPLATPATDSTDAQ